MEEKKKGSKLKIIIPVVIVVLAIIAVVVGVVVGGSKGIKEVGAGNTEQQSGANEEMTKEEMLTQAIELDVKAYAKELVENNAAADKKYEDKIVTITGQVSSIFSVMSECTIVFPNTQLSITVTLPKDDLIQIKTGKNITVVGTKLKAGGFTTASWLEKAYLVSADK